MSSNSFDFPSNSPLTDQSGRLANVWAQAFQRWQTAIATIYQSGPTASRPVSMLWVGRQYFDTTLNKPVWVKSAKPAVWVDATGASV